jgi:Na+-transporting methylmalonyl-CoA/oxaloacetate decarboxylase gamma subunit
VQGIAAITAANGWNMAITGVCIVMAGLAFLATVISQLHKLIAILEGKGKKWSAPKSAAPSAGTGQLAAQIDILNDLPAAARFYKSYTGDIGDSFPLKTLYRIFEKENLAHPHLTITALRDAGLLVPLGQGEFSWKNF